MPYTPRFAPRLATHLPWNPFGSGVADATGASNPENARGSLSDEEGEAVLGALVEAGTVVVEDERVSLDEGFRGRWRAEMADLRALDPHELADAVAACAPRADANLVETDDTAENWIILGDGSVAGERWLSREVAIAEVAAVAALADDLLDDRCVAAARPLRLFLDACPVCGTSVEETTAAACCGGPGPGGPDEVLACPACKTRLFTHR